MAKTVYTPEEVTLQDDTVLTLRPLTIARLKKAMAHLDAQSEIDTTEDKEDTDQYGFDFLVELVDICVGHQVGEDYDWDSSLDTPTAKRIIFVSTGIDFDDKENLMVAAAAAAAQNGQIST